MTEQPYLPFVSGSETSEAAADSMEPHVSQTETRVLNYLRRPTGATCWEVEVGLKMRHQTASARIRGLALKGRIYAHGDKRPTGSGRMALVWRVK